MRDITLGDTFYHFFTTRSFSTGVPTQLAGTPALSVLEENNATPITSGVSLQIDRASVTGLNQATIVATGGNGFEAGKSYAIYISTGTVGGVSVVGEIVGEFTIQASAAAVDLANGTDGLGAIKSDTAAILVDTGTTLDGRIPAALVSGRMDCSVGAMAANTMTASALATDAVNEIADGVWDEDIVAAHGTADTAGRCIRTLDAISDRTNNSNLNALLGVTDAASADVPSQVTDEVWDELQSAHTAGGSFGEIATEIADILTDTGTTLDGRIPAALVSGRMDSSVGAWKGTIPNDLVSLDVPARVKDMYEEGSVWIDTVNGAAGTTSFVNGTQHNPSSNIADATTIATNLGLRRFRVRPGSSITLAQTYNQWIFWSQGATLVLNGQALNSVYIEGMLVVGTCTGTPKFHECAFGTCTLPPCGITDSLFTATITLGATGAFHVDGCYSEVASDDAPPIFNYSTTGGQNNDLNINHYSGGVEIQNMGQAGTDTLNLNGRGRVIFNANTTGGVARVRGLFNITNNGTPTLTETANFRDDKIYTANPATGGLVSTSFAAGAIDAAAIAADAIGASELAQSAAQEIADEVLSRNLAGGGSGGTRSVRNALRALRNKVSESSGTLTVTEEDDTTPAWTAAVVRTPSTNPITSVDPA